MGPEAGGGVEGRLPGGGGCKDWTGVGMVGYKGGETFQTGNGRQGCKDLGTEMCWNVLSMSSGCWEEGGGSSRNVLVGGAWTAATVGL